MFKLGPIPVVIPWIVLPKIDAGSNYWTLSFTWNVPI